MSTYTPTIGIEVHAELNTQTKMFCSSKNDADEKRPNANVCPVCMAHPGTLPVINREAVQHVLRVGAAIGADLADYTEFDRKNYFYPDLPKGYQLSQYEYPLVSGGKLAGVTITRIHLEEDAASSMHDEKTGATVVDYNRAGVPLMELVTEPVIHSAEEAGAFARELQLLLRHLGASDANMEKGEMRVEVNVSVSKDEHLGTKVEVKNINSFRAAERAVAYEVDRQIKLLEKGEDVIQQTRGWDENTQSTFEQRIKEGSDDYRYFPDPDLPKLHISEIPEFNLETLKKSLPELPWERRERYLKNGAKEQDAEMFVRDQHIGAFVDEVLDHLKEQTEINLALNYIATDLAKLIRDNNDRDTDIKGNIGISSAHFAHLMRMTSAGEVSSRGAKDILAKMMICDRAPDEIAREEDLFQSSDASDLLPIVESIITEHDSVVLDYKGGKESALQFLVGQAMKASKGSANPKMLQELFIEKLSK